MVQIFKGGLASILIHIQNHMLLVFLSEVSSGSQLRFSLIEREVYGIIESSDKLRRFFSCDKSCDFFLILGM